MNRDFRSPPSKSPSKPGLSVFFTPRSVAVIGASRDASKVGHGVLKNLVSGGVFYAQSAKPFSGPVYPVNPAAERILGKRCHASVLDISGPVDLAVVCVPAHAVLGVVRQCVQKKVKACVLISAGFSETGDADLQQSILATARKGGMRILGPNTLGLIRPSMRLNASFGLTTPRPGSIAFLSQSGALADSVIDWALEEDYAFSAIVSVGNMADVGFAELIEHFTDDVQTRVISIYAEGVQDGPAFMRALRYAERKRKPVVVLHGGKTKTGQAAASTHTASLASSSAVFEGVLRQTGARSVDTLTDLFAVSSALSACPPCRNAWAVLTNAGGVGVLASDYADRFGVRLVPLSDAVLKKLDATKKLPSTWSRRNPLDLIGDATAERYAAALGVLMSEPSVSGVLVAQTLQTMTEPMENAKLLAAARKKFPKKPILAVFLGGKYSRTAMQYLNRHGVPQFGEVELAVKAAAALSR
ncbi:CoA-binding protein [Candidatus Micrarchaeota archaeon]|nr:CoA-binding protein [Candidatus Micrarchaeota archaeon]